MDEEMKLAENQIALAKITASIDELQLEIDTKQSAFDKLMDSKWKREEAERYEQEERDLKNTKNDSRRRIQDLMFEKQEMEMLMDDDEAYEEDREYASQRYWEIDDEIMWAEEEIQHCEDRLDEMVFEQEQIAEDRLRAEEEAKEA